VADHQGVGDQGAVNHEIGCALCILQSRSNILLVSTSALGQNRHTASMRSSPLPPGADITCPRHHLDTVERCEGVPTVPEGQRSGAMVPKARKTMIVALARKLLIALWRLVREGVVPEGVAMRPA
jgi:hypothetical protein